MNVHNVTRYELRAAHYRRQRARETLRAILVWGCILGAWAFVAWRLLF